MIQIDDIIKRSRYLNLSNKDHEYNKYHSRSKLLLESNVYRFNDKKFLLQHWESLDESQEECFIKCIDILEEAYELDNKNDFNYIKDYIINEVTPTVNDAKQIARRLKYKTTRMKNKITEKVKKNVEDIKNGSHEYIDKTKEADKNDLNIVKNNVKKSLGQEDIKEAYIQILNQLDKYNHCDRILENTYIIQKRFNIMNMVDKTDINENASLIVLVDSICECVNTYNAEYKVRLNTALETCFYFLSRKNKDFNKSLVLEQVVNNFISEELPYEKLLETRSIIESSVIYDAIDKINIEYIYTGIQYNESTYDEDIKSLKMPKNNNINCNLLEYNFVMDLDLFTEESSAVKTAKDIVNDFKLAKIKKATDVRTCISKMFTKSPDQIIDGTPNLFSWVRVTFILGATVLHPIIGALTLLVDQFIAMKLKRRDVSKMITVFKNERKIVAEKLKKTNDEQEKRNLKEYDKYLENGIEKLDEYYESLLSSDELSDKFDSDMDSSNDDEFDFDDFELESTEFENLFDKSNNFSKEYFTYNIKNYISTMNENTIDTITEVACKYPSIISTNTLYSILNEELDNVRTNNYHQWTRKTCLISNIRKLDPESIEYSISESSRSNVFDIITVLENLFIEYSIQDTIQNESVDTSIKMLTNKLRKSMQKAQDIDKEASRRIDSSVNMFLSSMQRAARNDNREAIIKGSIIPSASKVVKAAIIDGGVALINPAVAIILAIGQFAARKSMQKKERQLVLDEIEVELEMCKRYLRQAEDQGDLDAQKQLLIIQRNLERQKQRIEYNMKITWNQDVPKIKENDD